jgi:superfamily I DNA/RNA helicase
VKTFSGYNLSKEQEAAVMSDDRAIVVVASAGSGKTEVVARRVERLLGELSEESFRILALSYTVKAADQMRERFRERLGRLHDRVDTETVHGFAHSLLRQHGSRIGLPVEPEILVRDEDRAELLERWFTGEGRPVPDDLLAVFRRLDLARARCELQPLLSEWEAALTAAGAMDYAGTWIAHSGACSSV